MRSVSGCVIFGIVGAILLFALITSPVTAVFISEGFNANITSQVKSVSFQTEWTASGRVLNTAGIPASGLIVRVFDRDHKDDDLLGETLTDEHGDFHVIYHERDFKEFGEILPELYVTVRDPAGNELFTSRDDVRVNAGPVEYFLIRLEK